MAKIELMYPIAKAIGNMGTGRFRDTKNGPTLVPRPERPGTKHTLSVAPTTFDCICWKYADKLYQLFSPEAKAVWRAAVKAKVKSPYDLWMQECMWAFLRGYNAPKTPSISGGLTSNKITPDSTIYPPNSAYRISRLEDGVNLGKCPFTTIPAPANVEMIAINAWTFKISWDVPAVFFNIRYAFFLTDVLTGERDLKISNLWPSRTGFCFYNPPVPSKAYKVEFFFWNDPIYCSYSVVDFVDLP